MYTYTIRSINHAMAMMKKRRIRKKSDHSSFFFFFSLKVILSNQKNSCAYPFNQPTRLFLSCVFFPSSFSFDALVAYTQIKRIYLVIDYTHIEKERESNSLTEEEHWAAANLNFICIPN